MSTWNRRNEAYVWTQVCDEAYLLTRFNQSGGGVYIIDAYGRYKFSLHTDGNSHGRTSEEKHKYEEFKLPAIKNISTHCMVSQWRPIHPDVIRSTALPIPRPPANSNSIFIGDARDLFEPYCNLVIETYIYDPEKSLEIQAHITSNIPQREYMELKIFKEYELEDHGKTLGVVICVARFKYEAAA
jgi:hypothetical protein